MMNSNGVLNTVERHASGRSLCSAFQYFDRVTGNGRISAIQQQGNNAGTGSQIAYLGSVLQHGKVRKKYGIHAEPEIIGGLNDLQSGKLQIINSFVFV